jgi:hypothetical protein
LTSLKHNDCKESKLDNLQVNQVGENQAIATDVATHYQVDDFILEYETPAIDQRLAF